MPYNEHVQMRAIAGDEEAVLMVCSEEKPYLSDAIFQIIEDELNKYDEGERVSAPRLEAAVNTPSWYENKRRAIGQRMRRLGYYKEGVFWYLGKPPKKLVQKRKRLHITRSVLRRQSRDAICRIIEMCEADLARRDRVRDK